MPIAFSVLSWNIKHFGAKTSQGRTTQDPTPILELLQASNADVIAIYEVVGKQVYKSLFDHLHGYSFHVTEGPQSQEILLAVKTHLRSFVTQRTEFKSNISALRPGVLLNVRVDNADYPLLFLHLKSKSDPKGFGLRDDMIAHAISLRKSLNAAHKAQHKPGQSNFVIVGDLNTMGMNLTHNNQRDISDLEEIERLGKRLRGSSVNMRLLPKTAEYTWWPGSNGSYPQANLDHVIAARHLRFTRFDHAAEVQTMGWVNEPTDEAKDLWRKTYSDHAPLYFEVLKNDH